MEQGFLQIPLPLCRTDPLYIDCLDHPGKDIQYVYVFLQKQFPVIYQNVPDLPRFFFVTCTNPVSPARHLHQPVIGLVIFGSHGFLCKYAPECDIIHSLFSLSFSGRTPVALPPVRRYPPPEAAFQRLHWGHTQTDPVWKL